jgi:hypothetical protein
MQSILGAVLTAGYAAAAGAAIAAAPNGAQINDKAESELTKSFSSAADTAAQYPKHASEIIAGARSSFLQGDEWPYVAGIVAIVSARRSSSSAFHASGRSSGCSSPSRSSIHPAQLRPPLAAGARPSRSPDQG